MAFLEGPWKGYAPISTQVQHKTSVQMEISAVPCGPLPFFIRGHQVSSGEILEAARDLASEDLITLKA